MVISDHQNYTLYNTQGENTEFLKFHRKMRFIGNRRGVLPDVGRIANPTYAPHHIWRSITVNPREPKMLDIPERMCYY